MPRGRQPKPWYRKDRDEWCVTIHGKRIVLTKGKKNHREAYRRFLELGGSHEQPVTSREASHDICALFLEHAQRTVKPKTYGRYAQFLVPFSEYIRAIDGNAIQPRVVTSYLEGKTTWNNTTRYQFISAVKNAWNWAKSEGHITINPLSEIKRPKPNKRTSIPDTEGIEAMLAAARGEFKDVLTFIHHTGCRPGEAFMLEKRHVDLFNEEIRFDIGEDKTSGRTNKPRVIHLPQTVIPMIRTLCERHPTGPIFRNARGNQWTTSACNCAIRQIRKRANLDNRAVAYALRHHWATDGLARGLSVAIVAEMMGNSPAVVASTYSHLSDKKKLLMEAANIVRPKTES